jgi:glycosyltransferase involved in cell wall biosynthesis
VKSMRIVMLAQFYPPLIGGEERHVRNLSQTLAARGHRVTVATIHQHGLDAFELDGEVRVHRFRGTIQRLGIVFNDPARRYAPPFPDPELTIRIGRLVAEERADVVHAHNWLLHSYLPLKPTHGAGLVITLHDLSLVCSQKNGMRAGIPCSGPAVGKCLRCACDHYGALKGGFITASNWISGAFERKVVDKFLAVSRAIASGNRLAESGLPFEVIPNFVADDAGTAPCDNDDRVSMLPRDGFILYVGDLRRLKGVHTLIEAFGMLRNAPPLILIGRRCQDTPDALPPNVRVFESWPHNAVMQAWRMCLFGVAPSILPEACASVLIEAMASGKPTVATAVGGTPDLIDHGCNGLLVPPGDAQALCAAMSTLIGDRDLRDRMSACARSRAKGLSASAVVPRIERVYADVAKRNRTRLRDSEEVPIGPNSMTSS